jgi:hypothetical protein
MQEKTDPKTVPRNPLVLLVKAMLWVFALLLLSYVALQVTLAIIGVGPNNVTQTFSSCCQQIFP